MYIYIYIVGKTRSRAGIKPGIICVFDTISYCILHDSASAWCNQPSQRFSFSLQFAELRLRICVGRYVLRTRKHDVA